jgi:hypothetical protein
MVNLSTLVNLLLGLAMQNNVIKEAYGNKLKNQLFGLLCEYEKEREWESFLDSILIELMGFDESAKTINYYKLFHKVSSLRYLSYKYFRTTIFDCMNLISKV